MNKTKQAAARRVKLMKAEKKASAVIAVAGSKSSGKTTTAQVIIKGLVEKGYRVAAVKHVHDPQFTIDTKGKDTWLFAKAGAQTVVTVAPKEIATIRKISTEKHELSEILEECRDADVTIIEGFRNLVMRRRNIPKIVAVKNRHEIEEASRFYRPIIAFTGPTKTTKHGRLTAPYVDVLKEPARLMAIVEREVQKKMGS